MIEDPTRAALTRRLRVAIVAPLALLLAFATALAAQLMWLGVATLVGGGALLAVLAAALAFISQRQLGAVEQTYHTLRESERATRERLEIEAWVRERSTALSDGVRGDRPLAEIGAAALVELARSAGAVVGAFYVSAPGGWERCAGYALDPSSPERFREGEGLVGQAGREQRLIRVTDGPPDLLRVRSGTAERGAVELVLAPACVDGEAHAVVELGFLGRVSPRALELIERVGDTLGIAVRSAAYRTRLRELLAESQQQAGELRSAQAELEERRGELEASNVDLAAQRDALQRTQLELADKAVILARASQYKSEFLANMSHELRTPLNSTLIFARLLADNAGGNLGAEQVKFAETIFSAGNDLLALINDILDLSKIEAGKVDVRLDRIGLAQLLAPVTRMFEPVARERGVAFDVEIGDAGAAIETDPPRFQQILKNLLSNAFKFTEKGSVSLRVARAAGHVEVSVRDSGIGIPPHQHEIVFEAFRQADGTTNRKFGGTGLGLSISRELARHLGGDLRLESAAGQGSTFTLSLPEEHREPLLEVTAPRAVADDRERLDPDRRAPDREAVFTGRKILIADDDVRNIFALTSILEPKGATVVLARNGREALEALDAHPDVALVLMDVMMPEMDGLTATREIRRRGGRLAGLPILALTAKAMHDDRKLCLAAGASGYLAKPLDVDALLSLARVWMR